MALGDRVGARAIIRQVLHEVAPHRDPDTVGPGETLQEALDLDSLDFLHFVVGLHERTGVEIPEREYPQLTTFEGCVDSLLRHARTPAEGPAGKGASTWTSN